MSKFTKGVSNIPGNQQEEQKPKFNKHEQISTEVKLTGTIPKPLHEKLVAYEYWNRMNHSEVLEEALSAYLDSKDIKPLPEKEKQKNRPGRPKK